MSPPSTTNPNDVSSRRSQWRERLAAIIALVVVWTFLWGTFGPLNILAGIAVAAVIVLVLPLPPVTYDGKIRPVYLIKFFSKFFYDLVVASIQIAWLAFRVGRQPGAAIVAVNLRVNNDLNLTLVAESVSLVPGSLILEADRETGTLYIHLIGTETMDDVERFRREVHRVEARIVRAMGSDADVKKVNEAEAAARRAEQTKGSTS